MNARASISHVFKLQDFKLSNCSAEGRGSRRAGTKNRPATCGPVQIFALTTGDGANASHGGANDDGASALRSCPASHPPGWRRRWRDWPTIAPGRARPARPGSALAPIAASPSTLIILIDVSLGSSGAMPAQIASWRERHQLNVTICATSMNAQPASAGFRIHHNISRDIKTGTGCD